MSAGDAVISPDAQGRVELINPAAETLTGWRADEACGKPHPAQKDRAAEKRRLELACQCGRVALWEWDVATGVVEWSGSVEPGHRTGVFPHTITEWESILHPDDKARVAEALNQHLRDGTPYEIDYRVRCTVGGYATWHDSGVAERNAQGQAVRMTGACVDITGRKKAEVARRRIEESYLSLFENMLNGFAYCRMICEQDQPQDFTYLAVNKAFETLTGLKDVVGRTMSEVVPGIWEQDRELLEAYGRVARTGVPEKFEIYVGSMKMWLDISVYRPEEGDFVMVFDVITERKRVGESHARLATAVEQSAEAIVITDAKGMILYANPAFEKITGYRREEAIGQNPRILKSGKHDAEFYRQMWTVLSRGELWSGRIINKRKDGTLYEEEASISPVRNAAGKIVNYVAVKRDVTQEAAQETQLRESQKLASIGTLASGVAHEINNPINGIMNYAQLITNRMAKDSPLQEFATEIIKETERVALIVRNLLAFARQEKRPHDLADVSDIVTASLSLIRTVMRHDQITLTVDTPTNLPKVKCHKQQIQQVLMNLLTNARDALNEKYPGYDEDKVIHITVRPIEKDGKPWIRMTVEDHGPGIQQAVGDHIFDPFFTTKLGRGGTGLGLSISHGIVKEHNGELHFETEIGRYTRFHLDLLVTEEE
ncbi:MAG: PAS domain S-box protein [Verrucomicrobia bacterium]|nr:PAS domain S-box protein [Verrucomicrobiota bacterium]